MTRASRQAVSPDDPSAIEVTLSLDPRTRLYEGTEAVLAQSGITGLKTINLTPGDPTRPVITPGTQLPAGQSFMGRITGQAEQIARKVEYVANQLATWTSEENRKRVERLIDASIADFRDHARVRGVELCSRVAHLPEIKEIRLAPGKGVAGHVAESGETKGPFSKAKMGRMAADGALTRESWVWTQGQDGWMRAEDVDERAHLAEAVAAAHREQARAAVRPPGVAAVAGLERDLHVEPGSALVANGPKRRMTQPG